MSKRTTQPKRQSDYRKAARRAEKIIAHEMKLDPRTLGDRQGGGR